MGTARDRGVHRRLLYCICMTTYKVILTRSDEGYAVSCPALPGCHSQGDTEAEALENIRDAIQGWLAVRDDLLEEGEVREVEVAV